MNAMSGNCSVNTVQKTTIEQRGYATRFYATARYAHFRANAMTSPQQWVAVTWRVLSVGSSQRANGLAR
jgi:hypothetical protein